MHLSHLFSIVRQEDVSCDSGCITAWKVGFAAILLVEGLLFGHLVYLLKLTGKRFNSIVELGYALSAGVFFSAGLLHVLPEAVELLEEEDVHEEEEEEEEAGEEHEDEHGHGGITWAFLILMISFYVLFFVEQILVPKLLNWRSEKAKTEGEIVDIEDVGEESKTQMVEEKELGGFRSKEFVTGVIEVLGLSAHSLFESMALGLSSEFDTVLNIFIATAAHRWATSAAIAFKLVRSVKYLPFLVLLVLFSTMVPIGIGIGAGLSGLSDGVQGVLFAVSAGTFVYIGVYDSMVEVYGEGKERLAGKFIATLVGAGIIVVVTVLLSVFDVHG